MYARYNIRSQVKRGTPSPASRRGATWQAGDVWGAAAYAHRINSGEYLKEPEYDRDDEGMRLEGIVRYRNRDIMKRALTDNTLITAEDRDLGLRARHYLGQALVVKALKNALAEFDFAVKRAVEMERFEEYDNRIDMAVVASQIRAYEQAVQLEAAMEGISNEPVADIGAKVTTDITVVKSVYSQNYGVFFITGVTPDKKALFFSYRDRLSNGYQCRIHGTVKAHRDNSTQLNRVRLVDQ